MPPALAGGLVLIVMLIAFTIMQHAFAGGALAQGLISDSEQKALALVGAGHSIWDWDTTRDRIETGREIEHALGFKKGALDGPARNWLSLVHPAERDLFRNVLDAVVNQRRGRVNFAFRMRADDGHFLWFALKARPIVGADGEVVRCSGTIADITDSKLGEERLLHDSVHDNLTGLPNRQIFLDRLDSALLRQRSERIAGPTVIVIDLDNFKRVNSEFSYSVGDSVLLAIARRLARMLRPQDTLARLQANSFGVILLSETDPERIARADTRADPQSEGGNLGRRPRRVPDRVGRHRAPSSVTTPAKSRSGRRKRPSIRRSATAATSSSSTSRPSACAAAASTSTRSCARRSKAAVWISSTSRSSA